MNSYEYFSVDLLVIGGAITGMWAAIRAKQLQPEIEVMVIDKGRASKSGCPTWGAGNTACVYPTDDMGRLMQYFISAGEGLADAEWIEFALRESYDRVQEMSSWDVPFVRDEKGELVRKYGRGGVVMCAVARGDLMLTCMRRQAELLGVKFLDKVMVTELVTNEQGEVGGAVGFRIGEDEIKCYAFQASATVLVAGPCGYKAAYLGHRNLTGDGIAMAYRQGAEFMGMEFAVAHNTSPRGFDLAGLGRFVAMGAKFINSVGEEFMPRYDPVLGNKATFGNLLLGMATEVREGRGPIYFDMTAISPEDYELNQKILWFTNIAMERMGLDFRRDRIEWIPCLIGNMATGAGVRTRPDMSTTLPRVFTGGDTGGKYIYGAAAAPTGMNFAWCAVSGYRAGESAIRVLKEGNSVKLSKEAISTALEYQLAPLQAKEDLTPGEMIGAIQDAIIPYDVVIIKHADRLNKALQAIDKIDRGVGYIRATNSHELMKAHEANNMATIAGMMLRASLVRQESRGMHHREDFPNRDDVNWKKWLYLKNERGKMQFWVEDKPGKKRMIS